MAFEGCRNLTLNIPPTVSQITEGAFNEVKRVNISPENPRYYNAPYGAVVDRQNKILLHLPQKLAGTYRIPKGIRKIGEKAFYNCLFLKTVIFPAGVREINRNAFQNCLALKKVVLNKDLEIIGEWAFYGCERLDDFFIPAGVKKIGSAAFVQVPELAVAPGNSCFRKTAGGLLIETGKKRIIYCPQSAELCTIPEDIRIIDDHAFASCSKLKKIKFPQSVRIIGKCAFLSCRRLSRINIPAGVKHIKAYAFLGCLNMEAVTVRGAAVIGDGAFGKGCLENKLEKAFISKQAKVHREAFPESCKIIRCDFTI